MFYYQATFAAQRLQRDLTLEVNGWVDGWIDGWMDECELVINGKDRTRWSIHLLIVVIWHIQQIVIIFCLYPLTKIETDQDSLPSIAHEKNIFMATNLFNI